MISERQEMTIKIRAFEELILEMFSQNKLSGTTHTYIGEEATAAALMPYVREQDKVFSNHRCHGHYLAYNGPEELLLAEIMSKKSGLCNGRGGSQHIHYKNFYTNGIQGGIVPNALGVAFADKLSGNDGNTVVFIGDGTLGQGVVYESLNIASVYDVPVVFVVEDNQYAMSTKRKDVISGDIKSRIEGFDIKTFEIESTDVDELYEFFGGVFSYINENRKPVCAVVHNYRLGAHSKGDDTRDKDEVEFHRKKDPIALLKNALGEEVVDETYKKYRSKFEDIVSKLENEENIEIIPETVKMLGVDKSFLSNETGRYVERIKNAFYNQLESRNDVVFIGEDIRDPYGGAFKATKGLSPEFDKRVLNMPISEACMTGMAVGMGLNGFIPVVEMMFGDFVTLGFDQIINHASKYAWVYGDNIKIKMIIRVPSGAKRGYGPTHSQSLEKFLIGVPGIRVVAMSAPVDPLVFYKALFESIEEPTVVIENKKLYGQKNWLVEENRYNDFYIKEVNNYGYPTLCLSVDPDNSPDAYIITYGGMVEDVCSAAYDLMIKEEIQVDVVVATQLSPVPIADLKELINKDSMIFVAEEGTMTAGVGAELIASCVENNIGKRYRRIATPDMPIPNGIVLENQIVPGKETIECTIKEELKCLR